MMSAEKKGVMRRIQVKRRRFGWLTGASFLAVKEYRTERSQTRLLSFLVAAPEQFSRRWLRDELLRRFEMEKAC